jgi:large conductance mechanosensitive channel
MTVRRGRRASGGILADFRDFVMRGNVIDLAVAVILGAAFTQIINSLVADIITPAILNPALQAAKVNDLSELAVNGIKYGSFLAAILSFLIIAFVLFLIIRSFETVKRRLIREEEVNTSIDPVVASQENLTIAINRLNNTLESQNLS